MTKDVLISIRGMQFEGAMDTEDIEVIQRGHYYCRGGMHYLVYEEPVEGTDQIIKNLIKFNDRELYVTKKGAINTALSFRMNEKNLTSYGTPFGNIMVGLHTHQVELTKQDKDMLLTVAYSLDVNYEFLTDCSIRIEVKEI